jgi:hypothetical protein
MSAEAFVDMIEEIVDLKIQQHVEARLKTSVELSKFLQEKRETDRRRLEQLKVELVRMLNHSS